MALEVIPGKSVGEFILGSPIRDAIRFIKQRSKDIPEARLMCHKDELLALDIVIDINTMLLRFDPVTQRLKMIEIYDIATQSLAYDGVEFCGNGKHATFESIYSHFGPSYPGEYLATPPTQGYYLHYPGITFMFEVPPALAARFQNDPKSLPMNFDSAATSAPALRVMVYQGNWLEPVIPPHADDLYFERVVATVNQDLFFEQRNERIILGESTTQDVLSKLGSPSVIHTKDEDKMKIHSPDRPSIGLDYFFNYFDLGIDILFDGVTNVVKKFILHTNFPSHYDFNRYTKCNFRIQRLDADGQPISAVAAATTKAAAAISTMPSPVALPDDATATTTTTTTTTQENLQWQSVSLQNEGESNGTALLATGPSTASVAHEPSAIGPESKLVDIERLFGERGQPVVHKGPNTAQHALFAPTFFYGYPGVIFELTKEEYVASVCLYQEAA